MPPYSGVCGFGRFKEQPVALVANALTTVERVCRALGIAVPTGDALTDLEQQIAQASDAIARYCDRNFLKATVTEKVRGYGSQVLRLSRYPLVSITSVTLDGTAVDSSAWDTTPQEDDAARGELRHLTGCWEWTADFDRDSAAPEQRARTERPLYTVVYVGGYVLPGGSPRTLPYDIERACIQTVVALYRSEGQDRTIVSETVMSASRTYARGTGAGDVGILPADAAQLLERYRRWS